MKKIDPSQWIILSNERRKENSDYIRVKKEKEKKKKNQHLGTQYLAGIKI